MSWTSHDQVQLPRQLALGQIWAALKNGHHLQVLVFLDQGCKIGHGA